MKIFGLTGGIACGKTTVSNILIADGIPLLDCDLIARQVVEPGKPALKEIVKAFSEDVPDLLLPDGSLNRKALGRVVFEDEAKRKRLQSITGKAIFAQLFRLIAWHWFIGSPIIVIDAPTLYETKHLLKFCSKVVVVAVHPKIQLERLIARDNCSETEAMNRIKSQIPIEEKAKLAEIVVWNDGSKEQIIEKSHSLAETLRSEGRGLSVLFSAPGVAFVGAVLYAMFQILKVQHK